jgi:hypothetical protein
MEKSGSTAAVEMTSQHKKLDYRARALTLEKTQQETGGAESSVSPAETHANA